MKLIKQIRFLTIVLVGSVLLGCTQLQTFPSLTPPPFTFTPATSHIFLPTAAPTTPIHLLPEPDWLTILYPKPAQVVLMEEYISTEHKGNSGTLPVPDVESPICIEIWAEMLIEEGDFWDMSDVVSRTVVSVDGLQREHKGGGYDGIVAHSMSRDGKEIASVGGPYAFCMSAPVGIGIHKVDISFRKSSGMTPVYSWTFEVVEDSIPTATPLPPLIEIDHTGKLPAFLRAVYPQAGQIVHNQKYYIIEPDDEEVWEGVLLPDSLEPQMTVYLADKQAVCFAFRIESLYRLGTLPKDYREWPTRIYFQVDGQLQEWLYPVTMREDSNSDEISSHCAPVPMETGKHVAAIYIFPFDKDLITYSWSFTITK